MLTVYRRHQIACPHRGKGRKYRKCSCIIWADGFLNGAEIRKSLDTRDWQRANEIIREWEAAGTTMTKEAPVTIEAARTAYIADATARNLRPPTLKKYRELLADLESFHRDRGEYHVSQITLQSLRAFHASWTGAAITAIKKIERLKAFFRFVHESGWMPENVAARMKNPKNTAPPTMPFEREEMVKILAACDQYPGERNARRIKAFILLLRYSGLRIGDAISVTRDQITDGKLFLRTAKTGTIVRCPLPEPVLTALAAVERTASRYYFWTGESKRDSAASVWQQSLRKLFAIAGVQGGHAHRFRDTYAVELLLNGVPLERVSALLGHASVKVTEKHYTPWVRARQEQLEADVVRSWAGDPLLSGQAQPKAGRPN